MAQCCGLMPLHGICSPTSAHLYFRRRSARFVYCLCVALVLGVVELLSVIHMITAFCISGVGFMSSIGYMTAGAVFYGNSCMALWLFARLARRWPALMAAWSRVEQATWRWRRPELALRFKVITGVILATALVEHILSILTNIPDLLFHKKHNATVCPGDQDLVEKRVNMEGWQNDFLRVYSCRSHSFIFTVVRYQTWMGVIVFIISKIATFIWNYTDIFVCLLGSALTETYNKLNQRMLSVNGKSLRQQEWQEMREHYAMLSSLTKTVDENISGIVLLSFTNNLYFICLQLLNGLSPNLTSALDSVYFFGSFVFLLARTVAVTLFAARVHDESRVALPVLYNCPSDSYCEEVSRLQVQITADEIALTGMRFFYVTRNFMLAMIGAIVTYEVVLLQFSVAMLSNKANTTSDTPSH
ncbi:gustatory receptor 5a for trehalose-like [Bacillus rossius redtenbacheri]|uniref:gustatory receptor 5a for trehalose-like n=1 Tax=Bacillus rossius redtenbacheri TaxID=93214 RepID=UPI002FDEDC26